MQNYPQVHSSTAFTRNVIQIVSCTGVPPKIESPMQPWLGTKWTLSLSQSGNVQMELNKPFPFGPFGSIWTPSELWYWVVHGTTALGERFRQVEIYKNVKVLSPFGAMTSA